MSYLGRWTIDALVTFAANTHAASTGAATDADAVPTYRVYEDETGTPILTGSMALLDSANTAGFYSEQITLSAANGFEIDKSYTVYISATVGGVVGTMHHTFQIEAAASAAEISAIKVVTDALTSAGASKLAVSAGTMVTGSAITGTLSTTQMTTDLTEATDDHFNGRIVIFTSGALQYQAAAISDYDGATKMITMTALTEVPNNGNTFIIL